MTTEDVTTDPFDQAVANLEALLQQQAAHNNDVQRWFMTLINDWQNSIRTIANNANNKLQRVNFKFTSVDWNQENGTKAEITVSAHSAINYLSQNIFSHPALKFKLLDTGEVAAGCKMDGISIIAEILLPIEAPESKLMLATIMARYAEAAVRKQRSKS
jgi:hypothetical protein